MDNDELSRWLNQMRQNDLSDLERALGIKVEPERSIGFGVIPFADRNKAQEACNKLNNISGVNASQANGQIIVSPEALRSQIDALAKAEGWHIGWYTSVPK